MINFHQLYLIFALTCLLFGTSQSDGYAQNTPVHSYQIINQYPHSSTSFTQGLIFHNGALYESTGLWGRSKLLKVELETGEIIQSHPLKNQYFGEGLTRVGQTLIQLTWQSQVGFVYDIETFELIDEFSYPTEGWGITYDGEFLIMSDGTDQLYFLDPATYIQTKVISVRDLDSPVNRINELEYIHGEIFANVWMSNRIARINPNNGQVNAWIDLSTLKKQAQIPSSADVLNGIAYDDINHRLFVTGKYWTKLIEIALVPPLLNSVGQWKTIDK